MGSLIQKQRGNSLCISNSEAKLSDNFPLLSEKDGWAEFPVDTVVQAIFLDSSKMV